MRCRKVREGPRPCGAVPEARGCAVARPFARMSGGGAAVGKGSLPGLVYGTFLGGVGMDRAYAIAVDASGNAYVTGQTASDSFPVTPGSFSNLYHDNGDAFVSKLSADGSLLLYSAYLGGDKGEAGMGIAVNATGEAFITGMTASPNFPVTPGAFDTTYTGAGYSDPFVVRIAPGGVSLVYATYLGGDGMLNDEGRAIAADSAGNAYVTGWTLAADFPVTPGAFRMAFCGGVWDGFVTKFHFGGVGLAWSSYLGGNDSDAIYGIAVDASGSAYVSGWTTSTNFPVTAGAPQTVIGGTSDVFVARFGPNGTTLPFATYLGGVASDTNYGVGVDASENAIVTGQTFSSNFPVTEGAFQTHYGGGLIFDAFVAKVRTAGGVTPAVVGSSGGGCAAAGTPWMALLLAAALLTCRRRRR